MERGGGGSNILEDARHSSVLYMCKYFVPESIPPKLLLDLIKNGPSDHSRPASKVIPVDIGLG